MVKMNISKAIYKKLKHLSALICRAHRLSDDTYAVYAADNAMFDVIYPLGTPYAKHAESLAIKCTIKLMRAQRNRCDILSRPGVSKYALWDRLTMYKAQKYGQSNGMQDLYAEDASLFECAHVEYDSADLAAKSIFGDVFDYSTKNKVYTDYCSTRAIFDQYPHAEKSPAKAYAAMLTDFA
jgi:hypothetical protein